MPAANPYSNSPQASGPCALSVDVDAAKHDTNPLPYVVRGLVCTGTAGNVVFHVVNDPAGTTRTVALAAKEKFDFFFIDQVLETGTTATGLLGGV